MSEDKIIELSKKIEKRFLNLEEYKKANILLFYISYDNEVFTHDLIKKALNEKKIVAVPLSNIKNNNIIPIQIKNFDDELKTGTYGILEPKNKADNNIPKGKIDIVIVPGIAFDIMGYRIGHGLGYYDNFLADIKTRKIGFAFEFQILPDIPHEEHDIRMDRIVTERRVIDCI